MKFADTTSTLNDRTFAIGAVPVAAITAALGVWLLMIAGDLPDPVASHWGASGPADGFSSFTSTAALGIGVTLGTGLVCAACFSLNSMPAGMQRLGMAFSVIMTGFMAGVFAAGLAPQIGQATAVGTHMNWGIVWAGVGAAAILSVPLALLVRPGKPGTVDAAIPAGARVDLGAARRGESVSVRIRGALVASVFSATVAAGPDGLCVTVWGRWRLVHLPVAAYGSVMAAREIQPLRYGGWGYRAGAWGNAFVVRRGPALVVSVASGRQFVVNVDTVDNAERMAGLLNGYKLGQAKLHA